MEEKKNILPNGEVKDEALDAVAGGSGELESRASYYAHGDMGQWQTCWQCGHDFWYVPGANLRNLNDPWRHFCSKECKQKYEASFSSRDG